MAKSAKSGPTLDEITAQIEALAAASTEYMMKLNEGGDLVALLVGYYNLKTKYDRLDEARKLIYALVDNLNKSIIPLRFDAIGTDKIQVPEIKKSFYPLTKYSASIPDGKKAEAYDWLRERDLGAVITETVNAGTLSNTLQTFITDTGIDPPEDLFKLTSYKTTGMSNYTPKK